MTDDRDLTPQEEARVRRLLKDARATEPMPDAVAERLDRVLAGLAAETEHPAPAVDLDAARRRRRVRILLVAAAAVAVIGVGISNLPGLGGEVTSLDASSGSDSSAGDAEAGSNTDDDETQREGGAAAAPEQTVPTTPPPASSLNDATMFQLNADSVAVARQPVLVTTTTFADQARALRSAVDHQVGSFEKSTSSPGVPVPSWFSCEAAEFGAGSLLAVRYDGVPAVLAYREPVGQTQVIDLVQCGTGDVIRSTTVAVP